MGSARETIYYDIVMNLTRNQTVAAGSCDSWLTQGLQ